MIEYITYLETLTIGLSFGLIWYVDMVLEYNVADKRALNPSLILVRGDTKGSRMRGCDKVYNISWNFNLPQVLALG